MKKVVIIYAKTELESKIIFRNMKIFCFCLMLAQLENLDIQIIKFIPLLECDWVPPEFKSKTIYQESFYNNWIRLLINEIENFKNEIN